MSPSPIFQSISASCRGAASLLLLVALVACQPDPREQAAAAAARGDHALAAVLLQPLVATGGDDLRLRYGLEVARSGRAQEAARILSDLPASSQTLETQGVRIRAQLMQGDTAGALKAAQALVEAAPKDADAWVLLGDALAQSDRLQEAAQDYQNAVILDAEHVAAHIGLGDVAFASGDLAAAEQLYRRARDLGGDSTAGVQARTRLARLLAAAGRTMDAELMLQEALALQPDHPAALAEFGKHLVRSGYVEEALDALGEAQRSLGEDAELMSYLGFVYLRRAQAQYMSAAQVKDLQAAQMWLERAAAKEPERADVYSNLGQVKALMGDLSGAEAAFLKSWEVSHGSVDALMNLSRLYAQEGQVERARAVLTKALEDAPGHVVVQMNLGVLALRDGDDATAADWFDKATVACGNTSPDHACHPELAYAKARLAGRRGQVEEGVQQLLEALAFGFQDVGRIDAEPDLKDVVSDIRIANQLDRLRLRISN